MFLIFTFEKKFGLMIIQELRLKNFKRFTDLTIKLNPNAPSKLVLLIGSNGSGKSGIFDAFDVIATSLESGKYTGDKDLNYYRKKNSTNDTKLELQISNDKKWVCKFDKNQNVRHTTTNVNFPNNAFYGRSAIRYMPRLTKTTVGTAANIESNNDKPEYYIDIDRRFENDLDVLIYNIIQQLFKGINESDPTQLAKIKDFLNKINLALPRIFGSESQTSLIFKELLPPADGQPMKIIFNKGNSEINYDLLSSGEKEVINILFNLFVRTPIFQDSVYFFDELDSHLHTTLQHNLLKEIVENWIPENCQIWTASHSLGFIEYAQKSSLAAIIDLDNFDFDLPIVLEPQSSLEVFDIAISKESLAYLFKDRKKVFCENQNAPFYNSLNINDLIFLKDVDKTSIFLNIEQREDSYFGLMDRDYLSDEERNRIMARFPNLKILQYYCFENYLWHPDNLVSLGVDFDYNSYVQKITNEKNKDLEKIIYRLRDSRLSYTFFRQEKKYGFQDKQPDNVINLLKSNDFETFYKVFKMKDKGDLLPVRNLKPENLVKTDWFKHQIKVLFD